MSRLAKLLPRSLQPRIEQLRRDVRTVLDDLRGQRAPTWLPRSGVRYRNSIAFAGRQCEVVEVVRETDDALSLILRDAEGGSFPRVRPGQFFTILVPVPNQPVALRRAYSASGDCRECERVRLTIKRVEGGRASNWLVDQACVGLRLGVLGPSGEFGVEPDPQASPRKLVMIAAGSGVTPMMAILHTLLAVEPEAELALIYGNRREPDIMFRRELAALAERHADRLTLTLALTQPPTDWSGPVGRLDESNLPAIFDQLAIVDDPQTEFLLCGPAGMMTAARAALHGRGVADQRIRQESFLQPQQGVQVREPQPITIVIDEREVGVVVQPGQTVLEAGLAAGLAMPYSCTSGGCAACKVTVEHGEVIMQEPNCLGPSDRAAGLVLACIGSPTCPSRIRVG